MNKYIGQHWILLRGLARESAHWGDFIPLLQSTFPTAQITLLDLPGTGGFHKNTSPCTIKAITDQLRSHALNQNLIHKPVTILALSLGAMVAWEWMQRYPEDICGATLMNTSLADLSRFYQRLRWQSYKELLAIASTRDVCSRESGILQLVSNRRDIARDGAYAASQPGTGAAQDQQIALAWEKIQNERPISLNNSFRQIIAAASYKPGNLKPKQPVLLLNGQGDRLVAPACSEAIHKKWQLELCRHPWAGHDLTLDDSEWVVLQLEKWVAKENMDGMELNHVQIF